VTIYEQAVQYAKDDWGAGWFQISDEIRQAFTAKYVLRMLAGQDSEHVSDERVRALLVENHQRVEEMA